MSNKTNSTEGNSDEDLSNAIDLLIKKEAINFGRFIANHYNTDAMTAEDIDHLIPKIYDDYLKFCQGNS